MKLLSQKGMSLVEVTLAMGLTGLAAVGFMTYQKNALNQEQKIRVKTAEGGLIMQVQDYFKSSDICNQNLSYAFLPVNLDSAPRVKGVGPDGKEATFIEGHPSYSVLKNKGFLNSNGELVQKDLFKVGDLYEGGKIHISNVRYRIRDLEAVQGTGNPWTRQGTLLFEVEFERCQNGGQVYLKDNAGSLVERCPANQRVKSVKQFEKMVAFKTDTSGQITKSPLRVHNPATNTWTNNGEKANLVCADSQDALVEASKEYTDLKNCVLEMRMLMLSGKTGTLNCGISVSTTDVQQDYTSGQEMNLPDSHVPNSLVALVLGGGGGGGDGGRPGGGVSNRRAGEGGKAAKAVQQQLNSLATNRCKIVIGFGGNNTQPGSESKITCGSTIVKSDGGQPGRNQVMHDGQPGGQGENSSDLNGAIIGYGSRGHRNNGADNSLAGYGAGGGGGSEKGNNTSGKRGGQGLVRLSWKEFKVTDPDGVLVRLGVTDVNLAAGPSNPSTPTPGTSNLNPPPRNPGRFDPVTLDPVFPAPITVVAPGPSDLPGSDPTPRAPAPVIIDQPISNLPVTPGVVTATPTPEASNTGGSATPPQTSPVAGGGGGTSYYDPNYNGDNLKDNTGEDKSKNDKKNQKGPGY